VEPTGGYAFNYVIDGLYGYFFGAEFPATLTQTQLPTPVPESSTYGIAAGTLALTLSIARRHNRTTKR